MSQNTHHLPALQFNVGSSSSARTSTFSPRVGTVILHRHTEKTSLEVPTPGLIASSSRGVVPHLSRDHVRSSEAIKWVHIPFETFLETSPSVPTLQPGPYPLHTFLGFRPNQHILTMSLRDPADDRDMPVNGNDFVSAHCLRGVRKATPNEWRSYVMTVQPDVVVALSDIPFTSGPHSQKRTTKSIERSTSWLANILRPLPDQHVAPDSPSHPLNVLVHMAGGITPAARQAFAHSLLEPLFDKEGDAIKPLNNLDEGVAGYTFDLAPLHKSLSLDPASTPPKNILMAALDPFSIPPAPSATAQIISLIRTSLTPLPTNKPRFVHSTGSPHEVLALIRDVGIDLFDAHWVQRAADIGVALDFVFPAPASSPPVTPREIGHNLYDERYAHDFSPFADALRSCSAEGNDTRPACPCLACTPLRAAESLKHSSVDEPLQVQGPAPFTRAYVHHLLHTHEMSAHTLLVLHNLAVLDMFFAAIRRVLAEQPDKLLEEVAQFELVYDNRLGVFAEARKIWTEVSLARGKGRLAREKEK
ncbi:tRNA-guanine(15) transglycosylase-like protein [Gloeopeniophorella convolvens]|nr:tRNA-guanine(15) transglycosylase-like protein [Gloeopeniophorella convolvens]